MGRGRRNDPSYHKATRRYDAPLKTKNRYVPHGVPTWEETKTQGGRRKYQRKAAGGNLGGAVGERGRCSGGSGASGWVGAEGMAAISARAPAACAVDGWAGLPPLGGTGGGMRENRWRRRMGWPARRKRRTGKAAARGRISAEGGSAAAPSAPPGWPPHAVRRRGNAGLRWCCGKRRRL